MASNRIDEFLHTYNVRLFDDLEPPIMKGPTIDGTAGTTEYTYCATFETICGETTPSDPVSVTNGPDTLNGFDRVKLECQSIPPGVRKVRFFKKQGENYYLLGEETPDPGRLWDQGQAVGTDQPPAINTSGRPGVQAICPLPGMAQQRQTFVDLVALVHRLVADLGDTIFKDGDIISGGAEQDLGDNSWQFTEAKLYWRGMQLIAPKGQVALTGSGTEQVGVTITLLTSSATDDLVQRPAADEGVKPERALDGPDWLYFEVHWTVDAPGQVFVREFLDGKPKKQIIRTERTELQKEFDDRINDLAGSFVKERYPIQMQPHPDDDTLMLAKVGPGKAYPEGVRGYNKAPQFPVIPKARDVEFRNASPLDQFVFTGGSVIGTGVEPFDLNGLSIKLHVGSGNSHTVNFTADGMSAAAVVTAIETAVNAYPTSGEPDLVSCADAAGQLQIQARKGNTLTVEAVASDAYSVLGISTGTYEPGGTRIYRTNERYIATVSDTAYLTELVESVTHDGTTHKDLLSHTGVATILGVSATEADCHDSKFNWLYGVDFGRDGNYVDYTQYPGGSEPANGQTVYVKYRYNRTAVKGARTLVRVVDAQITKGAEDSADQIVYTGHTSATKVVDGSAVSGLSGAVKNVARILRVNDSPGQSQAEYNAYSFNRNANELTLEVSEINWAAAGAQGETPGGQPTTGSQYYCTFECWVDTVSTPDFYAADSYDLYEQIGLAPNETWYLRDCIDFRDGAVLPIPDANPTLDFEFYLPRIDKIAIDTTHTILRIPGQPSLSACPPRDQTGAMSLSTLIVPPYTYSPDDVQIVDVQNLAMPVVKLNSLLGRIERLEYYQALNQLEEDAKGHAAASEAMGIFTDRLTGQGRVDFQFSKNGVQHTAAIDQEGQCIRLPVAEDGIELRLDEVNSTNVKRVGKVWMFDYTESVFQSQLKASHFENVNPDDVFSWIGSLELTPDQDFWNDVEQLPAVTVNYDGNYDILIDAVLDEVNAERARQATYGAWKMAWDESGGWAQRQLQSDTDFHWVDTVPGGVNAMRERTATYTTLVPEKQFMDLGDSVVDMTAIPFMRTKMPDGSPFEIEISCQGLMPSNADYGDITIAGMIDGKIVDLVPTGSTEVGLYSYQGHSTVKTDATGSVTCKFQMPSGIQVGEKQVKIFDASGLERTWAATPFMSLGFKQTKQGTTVGFTSLVEREETVIEQQFHYGDPRAQTFAVESGIHYLSSVEIFFSTKDPYVPVTLEMRETFNGYPTRKVVAGATVAAADVNISADGSVPTKFAFKNIVGYNPAEHCWVLIANSTQYNFAVAELGKVDMLTGEVIAAQAHGGVLFHSPNNSTWEAESRKDAKMIIYEANFENNAQLVFENITGVQANALIAMVNQFMPTGCGMWWSWSKDGGSTWVPFVAGVDTELGEIVSQVKLRCDVFASGGTFQLAESYMGVILLMNQPSATYISRNAIQSGEPDQVTMVIDLDTDGTNGAGTRTVTPMFTTDDGEFWVELAPPAGYTKMATDDARYYEHQFQTPDEGTVTGATNATPIVIESANHGYKDGTVIDVTGVEGNTAANGQWRVASATADTFALVDPDTGADSVGNGAYTGNGTFKMAPYGQLRVRIDLATTNRAVTPRAKAIRAIAA